MVRKSAIVAIVACILVIGMVRGLGLFLASPLVALANNYDMIRVQACIDVYPVRDDATPLWANSHQAPLEYYQFAHLDTPCYFTSEAIFAVAALPLMWTQSRLSQDGYFSIRWVGAIKLMLLAAVGLFFTWAIFQSCPKAGIAYATFFALIVNDPGVLAYLSTFYAEFAAVFFLYLMLSMVVANALGWRPKGRACNWICSALFVLTPALLATSKLQHLVTPACLLTIIWGLQFFKAVFSKRMLVFMSAGALLGLTAQLAHLSLAASDSMRRANISNTVFTAILPHADNPFAMTQALGLPAVCAQYAGYSWFTPGVAEGDICPQVFGVSRIDIARAMLQHPLAAVRIVLDGAGELLPWLPPNLGLVAGSESADLPDYLPSLNGVIRDTPKSLVAVLLLALPLFGLLLTIRAARRNEVAFYVSLPCLSLPPPFLLSVVVFGDGYADVQKQSHLVTLLLLSTLLLILMYGMSALLQSRLARRRLLKCLSQPSA
ncbi:MAG TPA: hypothetical protein VFN29_05640 [Chiayiivirga sp.]|nr:hypothetical protein [Chiayiivirga sp.]